MNLNVLHKLHGNLDFRKYLIGRFGDLEKRTSAADKDSVFYYTNYVMSLLFIVHLSAI
jgi:hypothetical protein